MADYWISCGRGVCFGGNIGLVEDVQEEKENERGGVEEESVSAVF